MSRDTGKSVDDFTHLCLSIVDILTTPIGSRCELRDYGSGLFRLVDKNIDRSFIIQSYALIAAAIGKWEPRIQVTKVALDTTQWSQGIMYLDLYGLYLIQSKPIRLQNLALNFQQSRLTTTA